MSLPPSVDPNAESDRAARARQRRLKRQFTQLQADEREAFLEGLARLLTPGFDFYLRALGGGLLLALGFRFEQAALLFAALLVAPPMSPLLGMTLAAVSGRLRFFLIHLAMLAVVLASAGLLVWLGGLGTLTKEQELLAGLHTSINLIDLALVVAGALVFTWFFSRRSQLLLPASLAIAYEVLLPLGAAAYGLARGNLTLAQDAGLVFGVHLILALAASLTLLIVLGFRPLVGGTHSLAIAIALIGVLGLLAVAGLGATVVASLPTPTPTPTITPPPPTATATPTSTGTPTASPTASPLPTATGTATPIPPRAVVFGVGNDGVFLREAPMGALVSGLYGGTQVEFLGNPQVLQGDTWVQVRMLDGTEGWMLAEFLATLVPPQGVTPTPTLAP